MKLAPRHWLVTGFTALVVIAGFMTLAHALRFSKVRETIVINSALIASFDSNNPTKLRFGDLQFRGGLVLSSKYEAFGGISAIHIEPDGAHFLAVTDQGSWLRGRIVYRNGMPIGIADAEMAPILGNDGQPIATRGWYDTESLTELNGQMYVGIERVDKILRFNYRRDGLTARGRPIPVPRDFKTLTYNKSLECLAAPQAPSPYANDLIAVTEHSLDSNGNLRSFLFRRTRGGNQILRFSVKRSDDFDVSDCAVLPPNDLLLLERRFSFLRGFAMRIRKVPLSSIKEGATIDGKSLIEADLSYQIDNMEGIAVNRNAKGETIITLVSDDNFLMIQRSLLLQFALVEH